MNRGLPRAEQTRRAGVEKAGRDDMRHSNRRLLLRLLQTSGPLSQAELARRSRLSPATVSGILRPLIKSRLLVPERDGRTGVGRKAALLRFSERKALALGVAIEQEGCEVGLVNLSGRLVSGAAAAYPAHSPPNHVAGEISSLLEGVLQEAGVTLSAVVGAGITAPGMVLSATGDLKLSINLGWSNVRLGAIMQDRLGVPVRVQQDARTKAQWELLWGVARGCRSFVFIEAGAGLGAAACVDGVLLEGAHRLAGQIGHQAVDLQGPPCPCGQRGCLETFCSIPAVKLRLAAALAEQPPADTVLTPASSVQELGRAAAAGDRIARRVVRETAEYLGLAITHCVCSYDPELIILSGRLIEACPTLLDEAQAAFRRIRAVEEVGSPCDITASHRISGVVAAAADVCLRYLETLDAPRLPAPARPLGFRTAKVS